MKSYRDFRSLLFSREKNANSTPARRTRCHMRKETGLLKGTAAIPRGRTVPRQSEPRGLKYGFFVEIWGFFFFFTSITYCTTHSIFGFSFGGGGFLPFLGLTAEQAAGTITPWGAGVGAGRTWKEGACVCNSRNKSFNFLFFFLFFFFKTRGIHQPSGLACSEGMYPLTVITVACDHTQHTTLRRHLSGRQSLRL